MRWLAFGCWIILLFAVRVATGQSNPLTVPVKATLCDIAANPEAFNHHLVEAHGIALHGFEVSEFHDPTCRHTRPGIWIEFGGTQSTNTMYCCGVAAKLTRPRPLVIDGIGPPLVDDSLFRDFERRLRTDGPPQEQVATTGATLRGIVFAHQVQWNKTSAPFWGGYGHMGCCILLVVTQVVALDPEPTDGKVSPAELH